MGMHARIRAGDSPGAAPLAPRAEAAAPAAQMPPGTDYVVGPQDVLNVRIYGEEKLSGRIRIDNDGSFPFEYLGRVKAEGMTTAQIETYLAKALGDGYLRNPQVSVEVVEYRSQSVFVTGEVRSPNKYFAAGQFDADGRADACGIGHAERRQLGADYARAQGRRRARAGGIGRVRHARESARHSDRQGAEHQDARRRHDLRAEGRARLGRRPGAQSSGRRSTKKG